jgi:hypothetical protein
MVKKIGLVLVGLAVAAVAVVVLLKVQKDAQNQKQVDAFAARISTISSRLVPATTLTEQPCEGKAASLTSVFFINRRALESVAKGGGTQLAAAMKAGSSPASYRLDDKRWLGVVEVVQESQPNSFGQREFVGGEGRAWLSLFDLETGKAPCHAVVEYRNSEKVEVSPTNTLSQDLRNQRDRGLANAAAKLLGAPLEAQPVF